MTRIAIDVNARIRGDLTFADLYEDVEGEIEIDQEVDVYSDWGEYILVGKGKVVSFEEGGWVILSVNWAGMTLEQKK